MVSGKKPVKRNPRKEFDYDLQLAKQQAKTKLLQRKYTQALKTIEALEKSNEVAKGMSHTVKVDRIRPRLKDGGSEATCVWVAIKLIGNKWLF